MKPSTRKLLSALPVFLLCLLLLPGCAGTGAPDNDADATASGSGESPLPVISAELITYEDGAHRIHLPASGQVIDVDRQYVYYLPFVTDERIRTAEEKLEQQLAPYRTEDQPYSVSLTVDSEDFLCLYVEYVHDIDPPKTEIAPEGYVIAGGCGIDHEHLFFRERISS